jgi:tripartite-type tricarboxylate transporter receptor subunit TctC
MTKPTRVMAVLTAAMLAAIAGPGWAQGTGDYPRKQTVKIIAGVAAGGGTDVIAREVASQLTRRMGGSFVVENRTGASGAIAMQYVAKQPPDGYTLYVAANSIMAIAPILKTVDFDTRKAFAPIIHMDTQPYLLTVAHNVPVNNLKELIAYAKANPDKLNFGSSGYTSPSYTGMVDFRNLTGTKVQNIQYKGAAQAVLDVVSGRLQLLLGSAVTVGTQVKAGKVKALAVTSARRTKAFPDVPTATEAGLPGLDAVITHSLFATGGTPRPIILAINKEVNQILQNPEMIAKLAADGAEAEPPNTPEELNRRIDREVEKWTRFYKENPDALELGA